MSAEHIVQRHPAQAVDSTAQITNALSIHVEDYFQVSAFEGQVSRAVSDSVPCRVEYDVARLVDRLQRHDARATFLTLGWIAHRYPELVRGSPARATSASHGYAHRRATEQVPHEFYEDIVRAKRLLEDIAGQAVQGCWAPSFSISCRNLWTFDCIARAGYRYSSSMYPVRHDHYECRTPRVSLIGCPTS